MKVTTDHRTLWLLALRERGGWARAVKFGLTTGLLQGAVNQGVHRLRHKVGMTVIAKTIMSPLMGLTLGLFTSAATWVQNTLEPNQA